MFRRSRLSVRPNVGSAGRTAATPQEAPSSSENSDVTIPQNETPVSVTEYKPAENPPEQTPTPGDGNEQHGDSTSSAVQRRKRFSIKPKVLSGRPSALPRTPKSPVKPVLQPAKSPAPVIDKTATSTAPTQRVLSSKECKASDESGLTKIQAKPTISSSSSPESVLPAEGLGKKIRPPTDLGKKQSSSSSLVKEVKPQVLPSIPDREAIEISEKAKTLVSKTGFTTSPEQFSLSQLLNDRSDLRRLEKARKLRQLLRQEMHKGKKSKKNKACIKDYSLDPAKMTMRDLIHYLPTCNPMLSSLEQSVRENETVLPQSPGREESPERAQEPEVQPKMLSPRQEDTPAAAADEEEVEAEEDEEALMVPQVKVAEDGSLIIDEESLTVEVQRMKGPNPIQDRDPIFERGSTTTYSSFRKGNYAKPWSTEETDMFFLAISMVGTDFSMICQLFPHRARSEIKNKFKKEERHNAWRIDKAFRERRRLDLEYFTKLLEKILEFQQNKKKLKSLSEKKHQPKKRKRKGKMARSMLSDVEEENEDEMCDSSDEEEGEKENENFCNEKKSDFAPKKKRKRKNIDDTSPERPDDNKINKSKKKNAQDDLSAPADSEDAVLPEDLSNIDQSETTETPESVKDPKDKSQGKALLPLGRKGRKSSHAPKSKAVISDEEGEITSEDAVEKQIEKRSSSPEQAKKKGSDSDSSDEEATVQPPRPSRYGRVPKPVQPLNYPAKEDTHSSASETTLASPVGTAAKSKRKPTVKRPARQQPAKESKKPKLITLRASQSEGSEEEEDEEAVADMSHDENSTTAFVPASLCSPRPVVPEVEETMEELDMLAHMPDVLGMSENALCPDASCEQLENESEHQLDLLVDVIDFLSEHTEASEEESYNEAAQTLLAIGNVATQPTHPAVPDPIPILETTPCTEEEGSSKSPVQEEVCTQVISGPTETEKRPTINLIVHTSDTEVIKPTEEPCSTQETVSSQLNLTSEAKNTSSPARKGRFSKIKPTPNISRASRTTTVSSKIVCVESQHIDNAATRQPQSTELPGPESTAEVVSKVNDQASFAAKGQVVDLGQSSDTRTRNETRENQEMHNLQIVSDHKTDTTDSADNATVTSTAVLQLQTVQSSTTELEAVIQSTVNKQEDPDIAATSNIVLPQDVQSLLDQTKELELQSRQEPHLDLPLEKTLPENVQCLEKAAEDLTPTNIIALENSESTGPKPEVIQSNLETKMENSAAEEETTHIGLVNQPDSVSDSSKQSTPQRRRRCPKIKPNLVASPRTTKPRAEVKETSLIQLDSLSSRQQTLKEETAPTKPEDAEQLKSVNKELNKIALKLDMSSDSTIKSISQDKVNSKPATNPTTIKSGFEESDHPIEQSSHASTSTEDCTKLSHSPKISENITVQQQGELTATNQATKCASSAIFTSSGTVCQGFITPNKQLSGQAQNTSPRMTDLESGTSYSQMQIGTEFTTDHQKPLEGAVELPEVLPHNDSEPPLGLDQVQESSVQDTTMASETTFEYPSLLFPDMLSGQVPSDPDEPFFILSLTEIPVCPSSGQVIDTRPEPHHPPPDSVAQQSNPVEHVVPVAAGIDDSLSNIHIPTPEKAALSTGMVSVEEYLPSTPAVDISILGEPQGNVDVGNARQNLIRKMASEEAIKPSQVETTQEPPQLAAQTETSKKKAAETRGSKRQNGKLKASSDPPSEQESLRTEKPPPEPFVATEKEAPPSSEELLDSCEKAKSSQPQVSTSQTQVAIQQSTSQTTTELPVSMESDSMKISFSDDEPINVSQYFFSDVFTEVESDGNLVAEEIEKSCCDKPPRPTAATQPDKKHIRKASASGDTPCETTDGQSPNSDLNSRSELPKTSSSSSITEPSADSTPLDTRATRGRSVRKIKPADESKVKNSGSQRQSPAAFKSEAVDSLKETTSTPSQTYVATQHSTSEVPESKQNDLNGSSLLVEEPTSVSQSFISDIFTDVESDRNLANEEINTKTNTQSDTVKTRGNKRHNRKTKASSDPPRGQKNSQTEAQPAEESVVDVSSSLVETPSTSEVPVEPSQQETKGTRGRGKSNRNKKATCETKGKSSQSQRQSRAALKSLSLDTPFLSTPSRTQVVVQQSTSQATTEPAVSLKSDSMRKDFLEEEPTNVSQYFFSDAFTEQECDGNNIAGEVNTTLCDKTQTAKENNNESQTETRSSEAIVADDAASSSRLQEKPTTSLSADPSQQDTKGTRGKGRSIKKSKATGETKSKSSRSQRQSTAATSSKSPAAVSLDTLKETAFTAATTDSSQTPVVIQQSGSQTTTEPPAALESDSMRNSFSDEEPTSVSQYFFSDVFTEVDEEDQL